MELGADGWDERCEAHGGRGAGRFQNSQSAAACHHSAQLYGVAQYTTSTRKRRSTVWRLGKHSGTVKIPDWSTLIRSKLMYGPETLYPTKGQRRTLGAYQLRGRAALSAAIGA